ncbi:YDG domain-containing protein [Ideonella sp. DXS22W]|uniref:YDG domain-containing protein n=1 Tax=Pseudaquabacterium inlustre TaxID=2984192 RepID=A0ABU9CIB4_9BURK
MNLPHTPSRSLRHPPATRRHPALRPLALAAAGLFATLPLQAAGPALPTPLPTGLQVVQGQAQVATSGSRMTVTNSANAILNWQQFSIGSGHAVQFVQPDASSRVLNRVTGSDPSQIFGSLSSNGQVWLLNPNGVLFGQGARVDVAGLVASTLAIADADWTTRRYRLFTPAGFSASGTADVLNQGELRTVNGGQVLLLGVSGVRNDGLIEAPGGQVALAAGATMTFADTALPNLALQVSAPQGEVLNLGQAVASGGRIDLQAAIVNQQGIVRADSLGAGGSVLLAGTQAVNLSATSHTSASGASGGQIGVDAGAGGTLLVAGTVAATGGSGLGGRVSLLGRQVGLLADARVDVSGQTGGGAAYVGGGVRGQDAALRNADAVFFAPGATLSADALSRGDGGTLVLWGTQANRSYGTLSARGGAQGGQGGFVETSGGWLDARPAAVRTDAPAGPAGRWLLDPHDLIISDVGSDTAVSGNPSFTSSGSPALLSTATLVAALNAGNNVTVQTGAGGEGAGDISVINATIRPAASSAVGLTLLADRNITIDRSTLRSDGAPLAITLTAARGGGEGAIAVRSSTLATAGGNLTLGGNAMSCGPNACELEITSTRGALATDTTGLRDGVTVSASTLDAGSGSLSIVGHSEVSSGDTHGVAIVDGSTLTARSIALLGTVDSNGDGFRTGVKLAGGQTTATARLNIDGGAYSGVYRSTTMPAGVDILAPVQVGSAEAGAEGQATIIGEVMDGTASVSSLGPVLQRFGLGLRGASARLVALGGASVQLIGRDAGSNGDLALYLAGTAPAAIDMSQGGALTLSGDTNVRIGGEIVTGAGSTVTLSAGDTLSIDGARLSGDAASVTLSANTLEIGRSGEATSLAFGAGTALQLTAPILLIGNFDPSLIDLGEGSQNQTGLPPGSTRRALATTGTDGTGSSSGTSLSSGGTITLLANSIGLGANASLQSTASGDAITLAGLSGFSNAGSLRGHVRASSFTSGYGSLAGFFNQSGSEVLSTPNGRWLVYAADSALIGDGYAFQPGALQASFRQYGFGLSDSTPAESGSGFLFASQPVLGLASAYSRVYDGSTAVDLAAAGSGLSGLRDGVTYTGRLMLDSRHAGSDIPMSLVATGTGFVDAQGAPVYGVAIDSASLVGTVTPKPVTVASIGALDKVYDGSTSATLTGGTLSGTVSGDNVGLTGMSGSFADRHVGTAKTVTVTGFALSGSDAGNYSLDTTSASTTASITRRVLTGVGTAADKVYDGSTAATPGSTITLGNLVSGDAVTASASSAAFADRHVGTAKTVTLGGLSLAGADAGNYELPTATATASISPRSLTATAATAASKVYDGSTAARSQSVTLSGVLEGDRVTGAATGQFDSAGVGSEKAVTLGSFSLAGSDAGNYRLDSAQASLSATAAITPATLRYVADGVSVVQGGTLPALSGRVTGFVGEETQASATTGTLQFSTPTATSAAPGRYAIHGSGLAAANYSFEQAPGNAVALSIEAPPPVVPLVTDTPKIAQTAVVAVLVPAATSSATEGRTLDAVQVVTPASGSTGERRAFASLDLDNMSKDTIAAVLTAREQYKKSVFAQAITRLEQNPALADAPGCATAEQAASGQCLMFSPLPGLAPSGTAARVVQQAPMPVPSSTAPAAAAAAPSPAPTAPTAPAAPAVAAAPAGGTTASPATAPAAAPSGPITVTPILANAPGARLLSARAVKSAALPQIRRKVAVLVGIDQYSDPRIPRLANAVGDARAVAASLESNLGYETLVLENPSRAMLYQTLNQLQFTLGPEDSVVLYYAGHGELVEKTGQGYWQPADADATRPETWISNADIGKLLRQLPAQQVAMISDSCFSGSLVSGERIRGVNTQDAKALLAHRAAVVMSSGGNEPVFDAGKNGHSPFAWSLMQTLGQVSSWKPGSSLFEQIRFQVARQLPQRPQYGAARDGGHEAGADYLFEQRRLEERLTR